MLATVTAAIEGPFFACSTDEFILDSSGPYLLVHEHIPS